MDPIEALSFLFMLGNLELGRVSDVHYFVLMISKLMYA